MENNHSKGLMQYATIVLLITAIIPITVFGIYWIVREVHLNSEQKARLIDDFTRSAEEKIKSEVRPVIRLIDLQVKNFLTDIHTETENQTKEAYKVATHAYQQTENLLPAHQARTVILNALQFIFAGDRTGEFYLFDSSGNKLSKANGGRPDFEQQISSYLKHAAPQSEGFIQLVKPGTLPVNLDMLDFAYFKRFEPFNWYLVKARDVSISLGHLKKDLLDQIKTIRPADSQYFFVSDETGLLLLGPYAGRNLLELKNLQGKAIRSEILSLRGVQGGFIDYVMRIENTDYRGPKRSYIAYHSLLNWFIGTGMLFEDLDLALESNKAHLETSIRDFVLEGVVILIILLAVIILTERIVAQFIRQYLGRVTGTIENTIRFSRIADENQFSLREIHYLIQRINRVVMDRMASEAAADKSEQKYRQLFASLRDGYVETDMAGRLVEVNPSFCNLTGFTEQECSELTIDTLIIGDYGKSEYRSFIASVSKKGYSELIEARCLRKGNGDFPVEIQAYAVYDKTNTCTGIRGIIRDISPRKEAERREALQQEQLLQADKLISLGILTSGVAHEINNPNQFILTHNSLIRDTWQDAVAILESYQEEHGEFELNGFPYSKIKTMMPSFFTNVDSGANRIRNIVSELKAFSREYPEDALEQVEINSVIASAITLINPMIRKATHHFSIHYGKHLPQVWGHYQRLEQVIINLVQNACEALPDPERRIDIETAFDSRNQHLIISVSDQGTGIAEDDMRHLTDPFFTTRRDVGGTGLGLSICERIVRQHNGQMKFSSSESGTTVSLYLPVPNATPSTEYVKLS